MNMHTTNEVAKILGVSSSRIRHLVLKGRVTPVKIGLCYFFTDAEVDKIRVRKAGRPKKK
jgi:excisionase family DNA binding protein